LCAASGFSGAEYQVLVRQIDDFNIAEGVAQCGSMNRLIVGSTGPTGSGINLANVGIGQNLSSVSLTGRCGLPAGSVTESKRRAWHNELIKGATPGNSKMIAQRALKSCQFQHLLDSVLSAKQQQHKSMHFYHHSTKRLLRLTVYTTEMASGCNVASEAHLGLQLVLLQTLLMAS